MCRLSRRHLTRTNLWYLLMVKSCLRSASQPEKHTLGQRWAIIGYVSSQVGGQSTQYIDPMLFQCWPIVYDAGLALNHRWINICGSGGWSSDKILRCVDIGPILFLCWARGTTLAQQMRPLCLIYLF